MSAPYHTGPVSDHFDGERFRNRFGPTVDRSLADIWRWKRRGNAVSWPPPARSVVTDHPPARADGPRITLIGHASLLIQLAGCNILVDPVWSGRASPLSFAGPRRHAPPGIAFDDLPPIDAVLLTHSHYDHMDAATLQRLVTRHHPILVAPLGNDVVLRKAGIHHPVQLGDWGESRTIAPRIAATYVPANHWSSRRVTDRRRALWCGYIIRAPETTIYLAGDTGYADGALFDDLRRRHGRPDIAILPIGAYEPRWFMASQHMNPAEAVAAFLTLGAAQGLGIHWGCFRLTDEAQDAPLAALAAARAAARIPPERFLALHAGAVWHPA